MDQRTYKRKKEKIFYPTIEQKFGSQRPRFRVRPSQKCYTILPNSKFLLPLIFLRLRLFKERVSSSNLISEDEWKSIEETLLLSSIPGYVEDIKKIDAEEDWQVAEKYDQYGEWK